MKNMASTSPKIKYSGKSMWPFLTEGDLLSWSPVDNYQIGDVILFKDQKEFIIHRIVKIQNNQFVTKGDFSLCLDDLPLSNNQIIGKIIDCKSSAKIAQLSLNALSKNKLVRYFNLLKIYFARL
jgi:signal peptidase I